MKILDFLYFFSRIIRKMSYLVRQKNENIRIKTYPI
jgi:hypothetical protein